MDGPTRSPWTPPTSWAPYVGPRLATPPPEVAKDVRRLRNAWPEVALVPVICTNEENAELPQLLGMVSADRAGCLQPRLKVWILAACRVPRSGGRPCADGSEWDHMPTKARDWEQMLGLTEHHTAAAMKTAARKQAAGQLEELRCALLRGSLAAGCLAWALSHWGLCAGFCSRVPPRETLRCPWASGDAGSLCIMDTDLLSEQAAAHPSVRLVENMVRRATHRGSDVCLDTGVIMRPDEWPRLPVDPLRWLGVGRATSPSWKHAPP